ncbi:integration host factor subunit beta [Caldichromatium japonicum]|uniref:Integration host factor subunit beta n=1 Tax=Caldichromatium japonicum TaxID=2699430 RepID=A0A6G7VBN5_9GAMM|nr:integration host factor subunit beta [Caldichromatium japonicum]QIK37384.1 integration host factor subunit beta [Caldichromatium japonicum]
MTKSELINILAAEQDQLSHKDIEEAVKKILECMTLALAAGERIEIRGFGSFSLHYRPPRTGRNPKTGEAVALPAKYIPHFKPGKELRERVYQAFLNAQYGEATPETLKECRLSVN